MTIRRIEPDETFSINGVEVTGRQLAEARQELSYRGVYNPRWDELSQHDQDVAALAAGSYLRALADLVPDISEGEVDDWVPTYTRNQIASILDRLPEAPSGTAPNPTEPDHNCGPKCPVPCPLDDDDPRGWQG